MWNNQKLFSAFCTSRIGEGVYPSFFIRSHVLEIKVGVFKHYKPLAAQNITMMRFYAHILFSPLYLNVWGLCPLIS
ncbi:hypothetical protein D3C81_1980730 [compost metagenome]